MTYTTALRTNITLTQDHEKTYPLLFKVAMDVLPAQGSAVACERVFSLCKETDSLRRRKLSPKMMEYLQVLKQSYMREYRRQELSFVNDSWSLGDRVAQHLEDPETRRNALASMQQLDEQLEQVVEDHDDNDNDAFGFSLDEDWPELESLDTA